jgi:hypothetical protein
MPFFAVLLVDQTPKLPGKTKRPPQQQGQCGRHPAVGGAVGALYLVSLMYLWEPWKALTLDWMNVLANYAT